jgi:hypothetical protein
MSLSALATLLPLRSAKGISTAKDGGSVGPSDAQRLEEQKGVAVAPPIHIKAESLLWALIALTQLNRTPSDPRLIRRQQFAPPYTRQTLHEVATSLGLKVAFRQVEAAELNQLTLHCLGILKPSAQALQVVALGDPKVTPIAAARPS